jgi:Ser/Thr protein kinase RdoA (MazF antagonist)
MEPLCPLFINNAVGHFALKGNIVSLSLNPNGHINDTFIVSTTNGKYVVQRLNCSVFAHPREVMGNIRSVTDYLRDAIVKRGGDPERETLSVVKSVDGKNFYQDEKGNFFRCYKYIEGAHAILKTSDPATLYEAGRALGVFEKDLFSYPISELKETIPSFHNTGRRFFALMDAVMKDPMGRLQEVQPDLDFFSNNKLFAESLHLPVRVTHNDTKLTNVMFDDRTGRALCLIDLDTVMPGLAVFDFGDAIRYDCSSASENEADLSKVHFLFESYKAFLQGYLTQIRGFLEPEEIASLARGAEQMTYECGLRFLTDYLLGDAYFKVSYPTENLVRARVQEKLLSEMKEKEAVMASLTK